MGTQPLKELRRVLGQTGPTQGTVVSAEGQNVRVATNQGLVAAQLGEGISVIPGDRVRLEGTAVTAKIRDTDGLPVFNL